jgi:hypothetical protein
MIALRLHLARAGYTAGPLFRASINGLGDPLSYDAAHHRWEGYCSVAGAGLDLVTAVLPTQDELIEHWTHRSMRNRSRLQARPCRGGGLRTRDLVVSKAGG